MNNFWTLVVFEYKKIFHKKSVIITLALALALAIFSCITMVIGSSDQGNYYTKDMSASDAMLMDKSYEKALEGRPLNGNLILEASRAYQKIDKEVTKYRESEGYQKYARPYSSIYTLIDSAYTQSGNAFNIEDFQNISEEDANNYYTIRENQYRINLTNNPLFSDSDVEKIIEMDKEVQKPFIMAYKDGYQRFFSLSVTTIVIILFVISFCISPIFNEEYSKKTDSLILTSKNGKKSFIYAKIFTSISVSFILTLLFIFSTYFTCMAIYGFDGTNAQIQLLIPAITYPFTMLDATILVTITSLFGAFLHTTICMLISSFTKSSIIPMAITSVLILVGLFNGINNEFFIKLRHFLPSAMGNFGDITLQLVFDVFGIQIMLYQIVCIVSFIVGIMFLLFAIQNFKKHQVL